LRLSLLVQPRASRNAVAGWQGAVLKVRLAAAPVDGEANAALLAFIAKEWGLKKAQVALVSGGASRRKTVELTVADEAALMEKLKTYGVETADR
jgi:uncharacterized protein (TIGR00251 family)